MPKLCEENLSADNAPEDECGFPVGLELAESVCGQCLTFDPCFLARVCINLMLLLLKEW
jgi:hypothetical protein